MGRRMGRSMLVVVLLAVVVAAARAARRRGDVLAADVHEAIWPPLTDAAEPTWVAPEDGACPVSHPVKAKVQSGIFHAPGSAFYDRTRPDRCYRDVAAAEADGLRAPVRRR
jgi:hypothetical protein